MTSSINVSQILIYPVKSCRGIPVQQAQLAKTGLKYDRLFMLVKEKKDADGSITFVKMTQRENPKMALIHQNIIFSDDGNDMLQLLVAGTSILVPLNPSENCLLQYKPLPRDVDIWNTEVTPLDLGPEYSLLFSSFFGFRTRLTYQNPKTERYVKGNLPASTTTRNGENIITSFSDGYPIMLTTEESLRDLNSRLSKPVEMLRFRPNIVLKGTGLPWVEDEWKEISVGEIGDLFVVSRCTRCSLPNVDPETGIPDPDNQPFKTLQSFRRIDKGAKYLPCFGMNAIADRTQGLLKIGDTVSVLKTGEHYATLQ